MEIDLTPMQRLEIERRCLEAVCVSEEIHEKMLPYDGLKEELVGTSGLKWTAILFGLFSGILSLTVWRWLFGTFEIYEFLVEIGFPNLLVSNLPEIFALKAAAVSVWMGTYSWGVEGRHYFANRAYNAHDRSSVLHSVCEELSDVLPGAIPDLSDYAHNWDDDRPNRLVEIALGRHRNEEKKPKPRRREPPISAN